MCDLFRLLLAAGYTSICKNFTKISTIKTYIQEDENAQNQYGKLNKKGEFESYSENELHLLTDKQKRDLICVPPKMKLIDQPCIEAFEFCPSLEKTYSANKAVDCEHFHDSAVMWWYFDVALQHWNTPESFLVLLFLH